MDQNEPGISKAVVSERPYVAYALLFAIMLLFVFIRVRLLDFPLERDEGEYAYAGQLILKSLPVYTLCHTMKLPGTAGAYALIMAIFGQSAVGIHTGLLLINMATTWLMFVLAKRLFGPMPGVVAAACFALLSISPSVLGFAGHATHFVLLPALGGIVLLLKALESGRLRTLSASGLLFGLAFLMKQPGIFFLFFALCILIRHLKTTRSTLRAGMIRASVFLLSAGIPVALACIAIGAAGDFQSFWFWVVQYASVYGTSIGLDEGITIFWSQWLNVMLPPFLIWLCALLGVLALLCNSELRKQSVFVLGFLVFSFAAVCPGFYFRSHYFILLLPAVSLLCAIAFRFAVLKLPANIGKVLPLLVFGAVMLFCLIGQRAFFFQIDPVTLCRSIYSPNPFNEAPAIAQFIESHSTPNDRIVILGSEPEIAFYAHRLSGTGYIYMYPLMEIQPFAKKMQKEIIADIEASKPKFLVFVSTQMSWLMRPDSDTGIITWSEKYAHDHYTLVGVADMRAEGTEYHWQDAANYKPQSQYTVTVFERRP